MRIGVSGVAAMMWRLVAAAAARLPCYRLQFLNLSTQLDSLQWDRPSPESAGTVSS